jgi:hypothetical protein
MVMAPNTTLLTLLFGELAISAISTLLNSEAPGNG